MFTYIYRKNAKSNANANQTKPTQTEQKKNNHINSIAVQMKLNCALKSN